MEEKILIQSKIANIKLIRNMIWIIGIVASILGMIINAETERSWSENWENISYYEGDKIYSIGEYLGEMFEMVYIYGGVFFWGPIVVCLLLGWLFYRGISRTSLTLTDKRVFGTNAFGKRVDLPLDMISAVGTGVFKRITISTTSGVIKFSYIENRDAIYTAISTLLIERQNKPVSATAVKTELPQSNADELKKYKELLDGGVITQEEFDAKKKQLLGL